MWSIHWCLFHCDIDVCFLKYVEVIDFIVESPHFVIVVLLDRE